MHLSIDVSTTILIDVIVIQLLNVDSNQLTFISLCVYVYMCNVCILFESEHSF